MRIFHLQLLQVLSKEALDLKGLNGLRLPITMLLGLERNMGPLTLVTV